MGDFDELAAETVDAGFETFGVRARYEPPQGVAVGCTVIVSGQDREVRFGGLSRPAAEGGRFEIRRSEIAEPLKNGQIVLLDDNDAEISRHIIVGDPLIKDARRLVWICTARPVLP